MWSGYEIKQQYRETNLHWSINDDVQQIANCKFFFVSVQLSDYVSVGCRLPYVVCLSIVRPVVISKNACGTAQVNSRRWSSTINMPSPVWKISTLDSKRFVWVAAVARSTYITGAIFFFIVALLSRRSRQREWLSASVLSICSFVCLLVCL